jgi:hypothetical protein
MADRIAATSPQLKARIAGLCYLIVIVGCIFAEAFARGAQIVPGDAAATANNILTHEGLYRSGLVAELVAAPCYIAVTLIFYELFKPVNKSLSLLAAFFSLIGIATQGVMAFFHLAPLILLGGADYLKVFKTDQLQAQAYTFLKLHSQGYDVALVYFGFYCVLIGWLIFKSTFLPRILGVLMALGGIGYLVGSFADFISPTVGSALSSFASGPGLLGEGALCLWLLTVGLNTQKWNALAEAQRA